LLHPDDFGVAVVLNGRWLPEIELRALLPPPRAR
jgi:hypothetical protein